MTDSTGNGMQRAMDSRLDFKAVPKLIGMDHVFKKLFHVFQYARIGLCLVGPAGTGKTVFGQNILKAYAKKYGVPAYYVQGTVETTKTSLIAGHRLQGGSMVAAKALVGQAMEEGAAVLVDEAGHLMQEIMVAFNSIMDRWRVTSIGDIAIVAAPTFRILFATNPATHAANNMFPQSFASRLYVEKFDYPPFTTELKVTKSVADANYDKEIVVPELVQRYVVGLFRKYRKATYPLTARNMAAAIIALSVEARFGPENYSTYSFDNEAVARNFTALAHVKDERMPEVVQTFGDFIGKMGMPRFRECLEGAALTHLDVDTGQDVGAKNLLASAIASKGQLGGQREIDEDDVEDDTDMDPDQFDRMKTSVQTYGGKQS